MLSTPLESVGQGSSISSSQEENDSELIAKLLKQYQSNASYQSSIGNQVNTSV